jgi:hypothetical protein
LSGELVGPLRRIYFNDYGAPRHYDLPRDTRDLRYEACAGHHPACACREASIAEAFAEHMAENRELNDAIVAAIKGHNTYPVDSWGQPDEFARCKCQACDLARSVRVGYWDDKAERKAHYERVDAEYWRRVDERNRRDNPDYDRCPF